MMPYLPKLITFFMGAALAFGLGSAFVGQESHPTPPDLGLITAAPREVLTEFRIEPDAPSSAQLSASRTLLDVPAAGLPAIVAESYAYHLQKGSLDPATRAALARWAELDPAAAARWAESLDKAHRALALKEISAIWAALAPKEFQRWLEGHLENGQIIARNTAQIAINCLAGHDLALAVDLYTRRQSAFDELIVSPRENTKVETLRKSAQIMSEIELTGITVTGGASNGARRSISFSGISQLSLHRLKSSIHRSWKMIDPSGYRTEIKLGEVAAHDIYAMGENCEALNKGLKAGGADFANGQLDTAASAAERSELLFDMVSNWTFYDPDSAGEWLGEQGSAPHTWPARRVFAREVAGIDPAAALAWIETIEDAEIRESAFIEMADSWVAKNGETPADTSTWSAARQRAWKELVATARRPQPPSL